MVKLSLKRCNRYGRRLGRQHFVKASKFSTTGLKILRTVLLVKWQATNKFFLNLIYFKKERKKETYEGTAVIAAIIQVITN